MDGDGAQHLVVGTVQKPHGIKGELFVRVETDRPAEVFAPGRVLLLADAAGRPQGGSLTVERARAFKGGLLVKVAEHAGRTPEAEALRGRTLVIPRGEAAPLADDEVFYHELVGMRVVAGEETVGTVRELYEAPAGFLLGVERADGRELLVPFVRELVRRMDAQARVLEIEAPAGLLDL
ncbi:MAG TPA: ribosome maturation factor RimM [Longimicrobiaceae bacterium]|nr:ribosome maturation factor RimM [Longimicrobiaceae bacterium]